MYIYEKAIAHYGERNQIIVAIEELSELQKELCKYLRGEGNTAHIAEEMADVQIMLDQLDLIFNNRNDVLEIRTIKLGRLVNRMRVIKCPTCGITMDEKPDVCPVCGGKM